MGRAATQRLPPAFLQPHARQRTDFCNKICHKQPCSRSKLLGAVWPLASPRLTLRRLGKGSAQEPDPQFRDKRASRSPRARPLFYACIQVHDGSQQIRATQAGARRNPARPDRYCHPVQCDFPSHRSPNELQHSNQREKSCRQPRIAGCFMSSSSSLLLWVFPSPPRSDHAIGEHHANENRPRQPS